jgi:hypothetical protein
MVFLTISSTAWSVSVTKSTAIVRQVSRKERTVLFLGHAGGSTRQTRVGCFQYHPSSLFGQVNSKVVDLLKIELVHGYELSGDFLTFVGVPTIVIKFWDFVIKPSRGQ